MKTAQNEKNFVQNEMNCALNEMNFAQHRFSLPNNERTNAQKNPFKSQLEIYLFILSVFEDRKNSLSHLLDRYIYYGLCD